MSEQGKRVFISYVRDDLAAVDELQEILAAAGIPVWRDVQDIAPGDDWKEEIRQAIDREAVLFMPCFSKNSAARERSTMNEEMHLAAEVYRQLPPGKNWFMPVRLDDVGLPNWQIAPGRYLKDINYTDLFGPHREKNLVALTTALSRQLGQPSPDASTLSAALTEASPADRVSLLRDRSRELMLDPTKRIELSTLVIRETRSMLQRLDDESRFPLLLPNRDESAMRRAIVTASRGRVEATRPFCASLAVAAQWGQPEDLRTWADGISALAAEAVRPEGGNSVLLAMRRIPIVMAVFTAAIATARSGRLANLKPLTAEPVVQDGYSRQRVWPIEACTPVKLYQDLPVPAQVLALHALTERLDEHSPAAALDPAAYGRKHSMIHELIFEAIRPAFESDYVDLEQFADDFDRAEALLSALQYDIGTQRQKTDPNYGFARAGWVGRSTWRDRYITPDLADQLLTEAHEQGANWAPIQAGLFGGAPDRALVGLEGFADHFRKLRKSIF